MLDILFSKGDDELARVFVGELAGGRKVELVESVQPPIPREKKWVLIVSTLAGCPVRCPMCDAGGRYEGRLSAEEIFAQIDFLIRRRYPDGRVPVEKFKIQFARMGDPAFNPAVLDVLRELPVRYQVPGLLPSVSTVAPLRAEAFFEELLEVKRELYAGDRLQMQFSLHTTDEEARRRLVPTKTWSFARMAEYGRRFHQPGDRKITLNFATPRGFPLDAERLRGVFSPDFFAVKLTPVNPTFASLRSGLEGVFDPAHPEGSAAVVEQFRRAGFETILSIGEVRENEIGSNCGMYVSAASTSVRPQAETSP